MQGESRSTLQTQPDSAVDTGWETLGSTPLIQDRWLSLRADRCRTPDGAILDPYYVLQYPDWVNAVAITDDGSVLMTQQYRHGAGRTFLELPSGTMDPHDASPVETIRRELIEETGYHFESLIQTGCVSPNPANHTNTTHCFVATDVSRQTLPQFDPTERLVIVPVPLEDLRSLVLDGEIQQSLHVSSIFFALAHLGLL